MIRSYFYDVATGLFSGRYFSSSDVDEVAHARAVQLNLPEGHGAIAGRFDHLSQRVDIERLQREDDEAATAWAAKGDDKGPPSRVVATAAHVIDYQPPAPSTDHEWNPDTKRWLLSAVAQATVAAAAAAKARHAELIGQQHDDIRRAVLGDTSALERLRAIDTEVTALRGQLI